MLNSFRLVWSAVLSHSLFAFSAYLQVAKSDYAKDTYLQEIIYYTEKIEPTYGKKMVNLILRNVFTTCHIPRKTIFYINEAYFCHLEGEKVCVIDLFFVGQISCIQNLTADEVISYNLVMWQFCIQRYCNNM